jgi:hypothetical protein
MQESHSTPFEIFIFHNDKRRNPKKDKKKPDVKIAVSTITGTSTMDNVLTILFRQKYFNFHPIKIR